MMLKTSFFTTQALFLRVLPAWGRPRSANPNDDFAEMRAGRHVPIGGLRLGETEHFVDHRLDRVRCDGAVHRFEHLRRADRNTLHIGAPAKDQRRIKFGGATAQPADERDFATNANGAE